MRRLITVCAVCHDISQSQKQNENKKKSLCCLVDPVLVLLFVALWFILRGDLFYVLPCVILFFVYSPFSIAITSLGEERANLSAFRTFVRFVLVWFCRFSPPLDVWEEPQFVIVALPELFSYLFCSCLLQGYFPVLSRKIFCCVW